MTRPFVSKRGARRRDTRLAGHALHEGRALLFGVGIMLGFVVVVFGDIAGPRPHRQRDDGAGIALLPVALVADCRQPRSAR